MTAPGFKVSDAVAGVRVRGLVLALALSAWLPMVACTTTTETVRGGVPNMRKSPGPIYPAVTTVPSGATAIALPGSFAVPPM